SFQKYVHLNCRPLYERICATYGFFPCAVKVMAKSYSPAGGGTRRTRARFLALPSLHLRMPFSICHVPLIASPGSVIDASRSRGADDFPVVATAEGLVCGADETAVGVGAGRGIGTWSCGTSVLATGVCGADGGVTVTDGVIAGGVGVGA